MSAHIPRKRFGQNFLVDQGVINDIISAIRPRADDLMVEIGPGLGALTEPLMKSLNHLHCVEIDRDIIARLHKTYSPAKLTVHGIDALKFDFGTLGDKLRIVGNLPYNISSPLLFHLAEYGERIHDMHFMLQKEVVERMVAEPSTPDYGRLSVMLQYRFVMDKVLDVPPEAFNPPPKVDSAVVRMIPLPASMIKVKDPARLEQVVSQAFSQRRKTLRNNLRGLLEQADFDALGIDSGLRPENLSVGQFIAMADYLAGQS
ncbi:MAG: 16S rRNA (adenine(1518)-N(6)/adenine(1519)-N(6))-dimethyltransferase RsmA [Chitinivorax sp.]